MSPAACLLLLTFEVLETRNTSPQPVYHLGDVSSLAAPEPGQISLVCATAIPHTCCLLSLSTFLLQLLVHGLLPPAMTTHPRRYPISEAGADPALWSHSPSPSVALAPVALGFLPHMWRCTVNIIDWLHPGLYPEGRESPRTPSMGKTGMAASSQLLHPVLGKQ